MKVSNSFGPFCPEYIRVLLSELPHMPVSDIRTRDSETVLYTSRALFTCTFYFYKLTSTYPHKNKQEKVYKCKFFLALSLQQLAA
jgi:hypothetical protein